MYNILLGGSAGDGIETMSSLLEKILKKSGCYVFSTRDVMSRVRGGHNFIQIRFGTTAIASHVEELDCIVALDEESYNVHKSDLNKKGIIIGDNSLKLIDNQLITLPLRETARNLGNIKAANSVAIGAILKLFTIPLSNVEEVLTNSLKSDLREINLLAIKEGYDKVDALYQTEFTSLDNHMILSGNTCLSLGAIAAGINFYSAYPMSPSTTILDYLSAHGDKMNIAVEQAEDEIAAINMAIGASYAGAKAMTATSGGGFSLMVEALGFAGIGEIPLVVADIQRPGPATGLPTRTEQSDLKFVISASQGEFPRMVIALRHHEDAFYQTARAFALAEKYQMPVILLSDQYLADTTAVVPVFDTTKIMKPEETTPVSNVKEGTPYLRYEFTENGISTRMIPGRTNALVHVDSDEHDEQGYITESAKMRVQMTDKRMAKLKLLESELQEPEFIGDKEYETLLVGFGSTYGPIKEAVTILNRKGGHYAALLFGDVYPLPTKELNKLAPKAKEIINVEQNATGQLASLMRESVMINCDHSILKYDGRQLSPKDIINGIQSLKGGTAK